MWLCDRTALHRYSAVSVILPRVGARALLRLQPDAVNKLMTAVAAANNIAGPASSLLMGLLSALRDECVLGAVCHVCGSRARVVLCRGA